MAKWLRDPTMRRRLTLALAAAEVLALTGNFYFISRRYLLSLISRLSLRKIIEAAETFEAIGAALAAVVFAVVVFEAIMYIRGRPWARKVFMAENVLLLLLGLVWFILDHGREDLPARYAAVGGLLLPLATLFPLLWPLLEFRPDSTPSR